MIKVYLYYRKKNLSTLATDSSGKLNIFRHDSDTFGVDGAQVGVFEQAHQVSLASFLKWKKNAIFSLEFTYRVWEVNYRVVLCLPAERQWQRTGNANRSWNPGRFLSPDVGMAIYGSATQWISGNDEFHEALLYQGDNDGASWLHQCLALIYAPP